VRAQRPQEGFLDQVTGLIFSARKASRDPIKQVQLLKSELFKLFAT
jgi:hypothetical protein